MERNGEMLQYGINSQIVKANNYVSALEFFLTLHHLNTILHRSVSLWIDVWQSFGL
jgi:hypothetical protein